MKAKQRRIPTGELVLLQNEINILGNLRAAGKVAAGALVLLESLVLEKTTKSLIELNNIAEEFIISNGCCPTFKNYKGFPYGVCISVNQQLVHCIPSDYRLQEGDIVKFDLGATYNGAIADTALSVVFGQARDPLHMELIKTTKECLNNAIGAIQVGRRLGVIGSAIYKTARENNFSVFQRYGGHGIELNIPHAQPFIANKAELNEGIIIQPGLVIAIEPLLISDKYSTETKIMENGWDVVAEHLTAHEEHTCFIHKDYVEVLTRRSNENTVL